MKKFILFSILSVFLYSAPGYAGKEKSEMAGHMKKPRGGGTTATQKLMQLTAQVEQTQQDMGSLNEQISLAYHEKEDGNEGADAKVQLLEDQISATYKRMEGYAYAKVQLLEAHAAYAEQVDAQAPAAHKRWSDACVEWKGIKKEWQEWQEAGEDTEEEAAAEEATATKKRAPGTQEEEEAAQKPAAAKANAQWQKATAARKAQKEAAWAKMAAWVAEGEAAKKAWVAEGEVAQYTQTAEEAHRKAPWQRLDEMTYIRDMENFE